MEPLDIPIVREPTAPPAPPPVQRWLVKRRWSNGATHEAVVIATSERCRQVVDDQNEYAHIAYGHEIPSVEIEEAPPEEDVDRAPYEESESDS